MIAVTARIPQESQPDWTQFANDPMRVAALRSLALDLQHHLRQHLPDYMVPSVVIPIDQFCFTSNGKVDRKALLDFDSGPSHTDSPRVAPGTVIEETIARIWSEVLGVRQISIRDNFFDAGGDSVTGIQMVTRLRQSFEVEVPFSMLFELPTIEALAAEIEARQMQAVGDRGMETILAEIEGLSAGQVEMKLAELGLGSAERSPGDA